MATLPEKMKAVVTHGPGDYRLEEVLTPRAEPGEVVIRVEACGVCAGDVKCHDGAPMFWGDERRKGYAEPPAIPGHEFIGEVAELGEGAAEKSGLALGDKAVSEQIVPCWQCRFCKTGRHWMCQVHDIYGFKRHLPGGMAEYMSFPAGAINYRVPAHVPARHAVLIEPLACSLHAVERADIQLGDVVVVAGAGTLGLGMVGGAKLRGPGLLISIDLRPNRLKLAEKLGADLTINPREEDPIQKVRDLTEGYGCDVYLEATGHPEGVTQGLHMIRKMGTFVEFSVFSKEVTVDWTIIGDSKELDIRGAHLGAYCYPLAINALARGIIDVEGIVTHEVRLESFQEAFELMRQGDPCVKAVITP